MSFSTTDFTHVRELFDKGFHTNSIQKEQKRQALKTFMILMVGILYPFGFLNIIFDNYVLGLLEIAIAALFSGLLFLIKKMRYVTRISYVFVSIAGALILAILFIFSHSQSTLAWIGIFPMIAFFLLGEKYGIVAHGIFSLIMITLMLLGFRPVNYTVTIRLVTNILGVLLASGVMVYLYERSKNHAIDLVYHHSFFDELTGAGNRKLFTRILAREKAIARRSGHPLSLIMIDLDHFKEINDRHGHIVGDKILFAFVQLINKLLRQSDILFRWGGEEFIILLADTPARNAKHLANVLRRRVEGHSFDPVEKLTASLSVTEVQPGESDEETIHRLDVALYRAKENGRNQVQTA